MMILILGGSGSGKSSYAEELAVSLARADSSSREALKKYYLATMQVSDREGRQKVERHRKLRSGKGFFTIEQPRAIHLALAKTEPGKRMVLLECVSNLTANEMFAKEGVRPHMQVIEQVVSGIEKMKEETTHLIAVSSNVFEDGIVYDETTLEYIRAMGIIHQRLAAMADQVTEVVAGIPVVIKQRC